MELIWVLKWLMLPIIDDPLPQLRLRKPHLPVRRCPQLQVHTKFRCSLFAFLSKKLLINWLWDSFLPLQRRWCSKSRRCIGLWFLVQTRCGFWQAFTLRKENFSIYIGNYQNQQSVRWVIRCICLKLSKRIPWISFFRNTISAIYFEDDPHRSSSDFSTVEKLYA